MIWMFPRIGVGPQNGWFIMENRIKMDDLGVGNTHILFKRSCTNIGERDLNEFDESSTPKKECHQLSVIIMCLIAITTDSHKFQLFLTSQLYQFHLQSFFCWARGYTLETELFPWAWPMRKWSTFRDEISKVSFLKRRITTVFLHIYI